MIEKKEISRGLTLKALVTGIVGVTFMSFWTALQEGGAGRGASAWLTYVHPYAKTAITGFDAYWAFLNAFAFGSLFLLIIVLVNQIKPVFSRQEVAIIFVMTMAGGALAMPGKWPRFHQYVYGSSWPFAMGLRPAETVERYLRTVSPILTSSLSYWDDVGPRSTWIVNWAAVARELAWGSVFTISIGLTVYFLLLLFRRLWLDVEALHFPIGSLAAELTDLTQPESPKSLGVKMFRSKWFAIFFAVQSLWLTAAVLPHYIAEPTVHPALLHYGGTVGTIPGTGINIYPRWDLGVLGLVVAPFFLFLEPWMVGWFTTLSIDVLVGFVIGYLAIWIIYPSVLSGTGIWPMPVPSKSWSAGKVWQWWIGWPYQGANPGAVVIGIGLLAGLALAPIWRNRSTMGPILKGLFKEPAPEVDRERPIPYRITWLLFLGFLVLSIALAGALGIYLVYFIPWFLIYLFLLVGHARWTAESGSEFGTVFMVGQGGWFIFVEVLLSPLLLPPIYTTGDSTTNVMTMWILPQPGRGLCYLMAYIGVLGLTSYMLAKKTKTSSRDALKAFVIAIIFAAVAQGVFKIFWGHIMDLTVWGVGDTRFIGIWSSLDRGTYTPGSVVADTIAHVQQNPHEYIIKIGAGLALAFLIPFFRTKWSWLRVSAAGICLGVLFGGYAGMAPIAALAIKYVVLRVGGTKLYEEKVLPACVGAIAGMLMVFLFLGIFYQNIWGWTNLPGLFG